MNGTNTAPDLAFRHIPRTPLPDVETLSDELGYALWLEALRKLEDRIHLRTQKGYTS